MSGSRYSCPCSISPAWPWPNALAHGVLRPTRCAHTLAARRRILTVCRPCSRLLLLPPSPSLLVPRIPPLRGHSRPCLSAAASTRCRLCAGPARARLVGIHEGSGGHRRGTCAAWRNRAVKQDHEKTPTREANVHLMFEIQERWGGPRLLWTHMVLICSRPPVTCAPAARRGEPRRAPQRARCTQEQSLGLYHGTSSSWQECAACVVSNTPAKRTGAQLGQSRRDEPALRGRETRRARHHAETSSCTSLRDEGADRQGVEAEDRRENVAQVAANISPSDRDHHTSLQKMHSHGNNM